MNARQRKKKRKQWIAMIGEEVEHQLYCGYCLKKFDLKRNKYGINMDIATLHVISGMFFSSVIVSDIKLKE